MSLEIIEYDTSNCSESELLATIKQRTGLELEALDEGSYGRQTLSMRFPDMETAQSVEFAYLNDRGTFFIDADNHFLCYSIASGTGNYSYVDYLYKALVFDYKNTLYNVCSSSDVKWDVTMNSNCSETFPYYQDNDVTKQDITLVPVRVYAYNGILQSNVNAKSFIKNCYTNYERKFQRAQKFIDQNNNEFITLGGYLLYYNGKHK